MENGEVVVGPLKNSEKGKRGKDIKPTDIVSTQATKILDKNGKGLALLLFGKTKSGKKRLLLGVRRK